jgi:hypothetical protein
MQISHEERDFIMSHSEIARLRARIEAECQALQNLMLFSSVASHCSIDARYRNLEWCHDQLKPLVGEKQAIAFIVDIYNQQVK